MGAELLMIEFLQRLSGACSSVADEWPAVSLREACRVNFAGFKWPTEEARGLLDDTITGLHAQIERIRQ